MTNKNRSKSCKLCGVDFFESRNDSNNQWLNRAYCSRSCKNKDRSGVVSIFERLESKQIRRNGCWSWSGSKDGGGYGTLSNRNGGKFSAEKAHRVSYEMVHGPIPDGMVIRHKCDNPECTNPDHLEIGTQKDNARDMVERGRMNKISLNNLNHERKLTPEQEDEIRKIKFVGRNGRGEGRTRKDVAEEYGVCVDLIYYITRGKR